MIKIGRYKKFPCLEIKVVPQAQRNAIQIHDEQIKVLVSSAPEKGKANQELISFLSKKLNIRKSEIEIVQGETSRCKLLAFLTSTEEELREKIDQLLTEKNK